MRCIPHLPSRVHDALEVLVRAGEAWSFEDSNDPLRGFAAWPLIDWIGQHGLAEFGASMNALRRLTHLFTSEFAIRPFLLEDSERALALLHEWTMDPSDQIRRLVSEGTRPRLPWAMRLPMFQQDPTPVIALLEKLKDDSSEYVRRSVANNLNDIAKDHPGRVIDVCERWTTDATEQRHWVIRRATRTLVKQGDPGALAVLGFSIAPKARVELGLLTSQVVLGGALQFEVRLRSTSKDAQRLVVDYAIHYRKANGRLTAKVFKLRTLCLAPHANLNVTKQHLLAPISTRRHYPRSAQAGNTRVWKEHGSLSFRTQVAGKLENGLESRTA